MMKNASAGFTLVELAIVLMIIGLLIGGVLRGQELIENARVTATIAQVNGYAAAIHSFRDSYSSLPGDLLMATARLPGCSAANSCSNGDGNGRIGLFAQPVSGWQDQTGTGIPQIETTLFWKHLAMAKLISGVNLTANPASPEWGQTHPVARVAGGFQVLYWQGSYNAGRSGTYLRLQGIINNANGPPGQNAVSPKIASRIDRKMDDGLPQTGSVGSEGGSGSQLCATNLSAQLNGRYNELSDQRTCTMFFNIE